MKKLFFLLIVGLSACESSEPVKSNDITGTWEWVRTTGGFAGVDLKPENGEKRILTLNRDLTYKSLHNDSLVSEGKYTLSKGTSYLLNKEVEFVKIGQSMEAFYEIKGDQLYLNEDVNDGFNYTYKKK